MALGQEELMAGPALVRWDSDPVDGLTTSSHSTASESRRTSTLACAFLLLTLALGVCGAADDDRPNILFAISDDQSYPHASAYGDKSISTPSFDRIAREGVLFRNAFTASPGCSPSRAAILTGRYPWQNEHAGTHASMFSNKFAVYPQLLENAGYHVGYTGKGWGPGNFQDGGFDRNPAGPKYSVKSADVPEGIRNTDYAASFAQFMRQRERGQPFCFWYGSSEPHRKYGKGLGIKNGGDLATVTVPKFLPDTPEIRADLLDYNFEVQWFDTHLGRILSLLEETGDLDNTIVVVTSDNGMPFPRAKANCYEYGIHMPLAIRWGSKVQGGRTVDDLVSLIDLMPTYLEACGIQHPREFPMSGRSLMPVLLSSKSGLVDRSRTEVYSARERHSSSRWNNLGYPQRCIRTQQYLYIRNFRPERWPAGAPQKFGTGNYPQDAADAAQLGPMHGGYHDIDACPTFDVLLAGRDDHRIGRYFQLAVAHRPAEELFDIQSDPACINNLAEDEQYDQTRAQLSSLLERFLRQTGDARVIDGGEIWETYKRYSRIRKFPQPK